MKVKYLFLALLSSLVMIQSCQKQEENLGLPSIVISLSEASVAEPSSSFTVQVLSNRAWKVTSDVPWIAVDPDSGNGSPVDQAVTVTVMENTSFTRSGHVTFDIVYDNTILTVNQAGNGMPEDFIIYYNDFDKEVATQAYGTGGTSWPYLDQFEGWKNQSGVGIENLAYDFANVSTRNNSNSNAGYSDYAGSGTNNLLFGANGHFAVKNLSLKDFKNFRLSFGTEKYDNNNKEALFDPAELPVYVSADGAKWVPLEYTYLGTAAGRWNLAEAVFSVPADVTTLSVYIMAKIGSAYRVDDLKLEVSDDAGPVVDFSNGQDLPSGSGGGGGGGDTPSGDPSGTGTLADPYNVAAARNAVKDLTWTSNTEYQKTGTVYVKGKISRIADNGTFSQSGTYGNATFYISDDGKEGNELYCYRILYLENKKYTSGTDIKVGDDVVICGELMNYRGNTPETVSNAAYLYSLNESGGGGGDTPSGEVKAVTVAAFNAAPESDTQVYELVGTIGGTINTTYGNFDLTDETGTVYVYGLTATNLGYGAKNDKSYASLGLNEGDKIKIHGYRGSFNDKIEVMYAWFIEKVTGGDTPSGEVKAVTVAAFNAAPESDTQVYELVGTIGGTINTTYGNFDLTDETGTVYVYGLTATNLGYGSKNDKSYASLGLNEGDKIKIHGYRGSFNDKIEVMYAWFIEKVTGGGGGDTPSGDFGSGTLADPYTPAGAANAVKDLTWTSNSEYQTTEDVYVKGKISRIANKGTFTEGGTYGNASFYISEDGSEKDEFYCFRILYLENKKFAEGNTDIKQGDEVIICGKLMNYQGTTPETVSGKAYLYSLNGKTSGEAGGSGTLADPYTPAGAANAVKDLTWTSNSEYQTTEDVYVKGKISRIANKGTFTEGGTYGNASFYISEDGSEKDEFYCFRILYLENKKFAEGNTDIKQGDEVIICGKLMNYQGTTPETVSGKAYLYSLNGKTSGEAGGGDTPGGSSVSFSTNSDAQTWAADTDGTYGSGYATTTQGLKIAYYKHTSTSNPVAPNANHIRVYKNSALCIGSTEGKKIKKIVLGCAPDSGTTSYCFDMTGLEGGASATADKEAKTVTWTGSASKVVLHANNGQVRVEKVTIEFE